MPPPMKRMTKSSVKQEEPITFDFDVRNGGKETMHPLMMLAKAVGMMNPRQFELPKDMNSHLQLPGEYRGLFGVWAGA